MGAMGLNLNLGAMNSSAEKEKARGELRRELRRMREALPQTHVAVQRIEMKFID